MKFEISKVEKLKSENQKKILSQKMFEKIISVKMDHRVSISSSKECIEWSLKMKIKNEISKVEKLKSENQKKIISQKMFEKIQSVQTDHRVNISSMY